jgi:hypothetical protein
MKGDIMKIQEPVVDEWLEAQGRVKTKEIVPEETTEQDEKGGITVRARKKWQDTGIQCSRGDVITIRYKSGLWNVNPHHSGLYDAEGSSYIAHQHGYIVVGAAEGALCGRIGSSGQAFYIGNTGRIVADRNGTLQLIANDDYVGRYGAGFSDNKGAIKVDID